MADIVKELKASAYTVASLAKIFQDYFRGDSKDIEVKYMNPDGEVKSITIPNVRKLTDEIKAVSINEDQLKDALKKYYTKDEIDDTVSDLKTKINDETKKVNDDLNSKIDSTKSDLNNKIEGLDSKLENTKSDLKSKIDKLKDDTNELINTVEDNAKNYTDDKVMTTKDNFNKELNIVKKEHGLSLAASELLNDTTRLRSSGVIEYGSENSFTILNSKDINIVDERKYRGRYDKPYKLRNSFDKYKGLIGFGHGSFTSTNKKIGGVVKLDINGEVIELKGLSLYGDYGYYVYRGFDYALKASDGIRPGDVVKINDLTNTPKIKPEQFIIISDNEREFCPDVNLEKIDNMFAVNAKLSHDDDGNLVVDDSDNSGDYSSARMNIKVIPDMEYVVEVDVVDIGTTNVFFTAWDGKDNKRDADGDVHKHLYLVEGKNTITIKAKSEYMTIGLGVGKDGKAKYKSVSIKPAKKETIYYTLPDFEPMSDGSNLLDSDNLRKLIRVNDISAFDYFFLEAWYEDISERGFVYPYGNTQWNVDEPGEFKFDKLKEGDFGDADIYSLFSDKDKPGSLVGKGWKWDELTEDEKAKLLSSSKHKLYKVGDKIVQFRYRARRVTLPSVLYNINLEKSIPDLNESGYWTLNNIYINYHILPKGKKPNRKDFVNTTDTIYIFNSLHYSEGGENPKPGIAQSEGFIDTFIYGDRGNKNLDIGFDNRAVYGMDLIKVTRRNYGVYHPIYNKPGTARAYHDGKGKLWWQLPNDYINSLEECLNHDKIAVINDDDVTDAAKYSDYESGDVSKDTHTPTFVFSGYSGRPDLMSVDHVYGEDINDIRPVSNDGNLVNYFENVINDYMNGKIRGYERYYNNFRVFPCGVYGEHSRKGIEKRDKRSSCVVYEGQYCANGYNVDMSNISYYKPMSLFNNTDVKSIGLLYLNDIDRYGYITRHGNKWHSRLSFNVNGRITDKDYDYKFVAYDEEVTFIPFSPRYMHDYDDVTFNIDYVSNGETIITEIHGSPMRLMDKVNYVTNSGDDKKANIRIGTIVKADGKYYESRIERGVITIDPDTEDYDNEDNWWYISDNDNDGGYPEEWLKNGLPGIPVVRNVFGHVVTNLASIRSINNLPIYYYNFATRNMKEILEVIRINVKTGEVTRLTKGEITNIKNTYSVSNGKAIRFSLAKNCDDGEFNNPADAFHNSVFLITYKTDTSKVTLPNYNIKNTKFNNELYIGNTYVTNDVLKDAMKYGYEKRFIKTTNLIIKNNEKAIHTKIEKIIENISNNIDDIKLIPFITARDNGDNYELKVGFAYQELINRHISHNGNKYLPNEYDENIKFLNYNNVNIDRDSHEFEIDLDEKYTYLGMVINSVDAPNDINFYGKISSDGDYEFLGNLKNIGVKIDNYKYMVSLRNFKYKYIKVSSELEYIKIETMFGSKQSISTYENNFYLSYIIDDGKISLSNKSNKNFKPLNNINVEEGVRVISGPKLYIKKTRWI